ncbi:MAG: tetratricopeptide repeat protein [Prevotellaceae bacterium]|jgi:tetratricopeptide (TPR) repeat protein|nr:tetratricopeptide repeat protein [Prevotellaceae bacterium]
MIIVSNTIRKIASTFFAATLPLLAVAQADTAWQKANALYAEGKYKDASAAYLQLEESGKASSALFYNAGNAFYKQGETAKAILYYERALRLAPDDEDIRYNLELSNLQIVDKIEPIPQFFVVAWIQAFCNLLDVDTWGIVGISLFAATLMLALVVLFGRTSRRKKAAFALAVACLSLSIVATCVAMREKRYLSSHTEAIVYAPVTSVKASPDAGGVDLFVLHEGTKVSVLETIGSWKKVKTADGNQGWLPTAAIENI